MEKRIPQPLKEKDTFSVAEFARHLPCSVRQAYVLVDKGLSDGGVDSFRVGERNGIRIPKEELPRFRASRRVEDLNNGATS